MAVTFITWLWGTKYSHVDVGKLVSSVRRNMSTPHRFIVFSEHSIALPRPIEVEALRDRDLIGRGCFCRLRMFDPEWQRQYRMEDRIVSLDLDNVIVGRLDDVFHSSEDFMILRGVNAVNPNPFNCSVMMLKPGKYPEVWSEFSLEKAQTIKYHEFPDDQGWIWHMLPNAKGWDGGERSGIYAFQKPGWDVPADYVPRTARIISFIGWRKPALFQHLGWVRKHWRSGR